MVILPLNPRVTLQIRMIRMQMDQAKIQLEKFQHQSSHSSHNKEKNLAHLKKENHKRRAQYQTTRIHPHGCHKCLILNNCSVSEVKRNLKKLKRIKQMEPQEVLQQLQDQELLKMAQMVVVVLQILDKELLLSPKRNQYHLM
jgi:hypothetical protein